MTHLSDTEVLTSLITRVRPSYRLYNQMNQILDTLRVSQIFAEALTNSRNVFMRCITVIVNRN